MKTLIMIDERYPDIIYSSSRPGFYGRLVNEEKDWGL
jgi:hypothetical protein